MAKLFVGLNFRESGLLSKKITGFRQRFDPKYRNYCFPHMSMLAPFEIEDRDLDDLQETLKEELETFFYGVKNSFNLGVTGLGFSQNKRKYILQLNPFYNTNLDFCSEIVKEICKSYLTRRVHYKENKKQFIPLGVFNSPEEMNIVMEHARLEFQNYNEIEIESISLYQKRSGVWVEKEILVSFEENDDRFLQLNNLTL